MFVFYRARSHDAGDAAAGGDDHRDERLPGEAEAAEYPVEDEGDARHIPGIFKDRQQREEDQHLRHEAEDRADAGDDPVKDQALEPIRDIQRREDSLSRRRDDLAEEDVVRPVCHESAHRRHRDVVNGEDDRREYRQRHHADCHKLFS